MNDLYPGTGADRELRHVLRSAEVQFDREARIREVARRRAGDKEWAFVLNHTAEVQTVTLPGQFKSKLAGDALEGSVSLGGWYLQRA